MSDVQPIAYSLSIPGDRLVFDTERKIHFLRQVAVTGALQKSARKSGVSPSTVKAHLVSDPAFQAAYEEALDDFKEVIEGEVYRRAIVGWEEEIYQQGEFVGTVRKFDQKLLEMLAKKFMPEYREKHEVTHNVAPGVLAVPVRQSESEWVNAREAEIVQEQDEELLPSGGLQPEKAGAESGQ